MIPRLEWYLYMYYVELELESLQRAFWSIFRVSQPTAPSQEVNIVTVDSYSKGDPAREENLALPGT